MDVYTFLVILHVIGTILGTGGATVAEFQITRALKDSRVSADERALMHVNYGMIRAGMAVLLVSVLGMFWYFQTQASNPMFTSEKLWIKELMFVMIFVNALALHKRWVPLWLGASISFTSWWGATLLGLAGQLPYSFLTYLVGYVIAIFTLAGLFHVLRKWSKKGMFTTRTTLLSFTIILTSVLAVIYFLIQNEQARENVETPEREVQSEEYRTLTETATFAYPGGSHTYEFVFALDEDGVIQSIDGADVDPENQGNIADFLAEVNERVVGKQLEELEPLAKVAGASLTTQAFNEAIGRIQDTNGSG